MAKSLLVCHCCSLSILSKTNHHVKESLKKCCIQHLLTPIPNLCPSLFSDNLLLLYSGTGQALKMFISTPAYLHPIPQGPVAMPTEVRQRGSLAGKSVLLNLIAAQVI